MAQIELSLNELFKAQDSIKHYLTDYYVNDSVTKMLKGIEKKIKTAIKQEQKK